MNGLSPLQSYHLSFGHELTHLHKSTSELLMNWNVELSVLGGIMFLYFAIQPAGANLFGPWSVAIGVAVLFAATLIPVMFLSLTDKHGHRGKTREEIIAELGAAQLAAATGVTPGLTEYSAQYIARYLSDIRADWRLQTLRAAHKIAIKRYRRIVSLQPLTTSPSQTRQHEA
jgi:hypothetical protein